MGTHYQKVHFDDLPGFRVHHTAGPDAAKSTIQRLHLNNHYMILYLRQGSGNIIVENHSYRIRPGDIVIMDIGEPFHCTIDPDRYHERVSVHIDPRFWKRFPWDTSPLFRIFTDRSRGSGNLIPAEAVNQSGLSSLLGELLAIAQMDSPTRDALAVSKLIQTLNSLEHITKTVEIPAEAAVSNPLIHRVLQHLNEHFTENITVASVATHFHITPSHLSHIFKQQAGIPLWNYVILQRLHYANALMAKNISAEEACYTVGFDNYANFYRVYKKHTGITPSEYKKQVQFHSKDAILNKTT